MMSGDRYGWAYKWPKSYGPAVKQVIRQAIRKQCKDLGISVRSMGLFLYKNEVYYNPLDPDAAQCDQYVLEVYEKGGYYE